MPPTEFVAFDLETTGLSPWFDRIVELGAVRFRQDGTELGRFTQLVDPGIPIPREVVRVHGITTEMVRGQPPLHAVLGSFHRFLGNARTILLAHNAEFDVGFLSQAFNNAGLESPEHIIFDTLELARWRLPELRSHRLVSCCSHFQIAQQRAHRALADALAVKELFLQLQSAMPKLSLGQLRSGLTSHRFEIVSASAAQVPVGCEPILRAIEGQESLSILYAGGHQSLKPRRITPRKLFELRRFVYVLALCHRDNIEKHFRLDRILQIFEGPGSGL